jgi:hypothetical protein
MCGSRSLAKAAVSFSIHPCRAFFDPGRGARGVWICARSDDGRDWRGTSVAHDAVDRHSLRTGSLSLRSREPFARHRTAGTTRQLLLTVSRIGMAVVMIGPAMDEVLASLQYLKRRYGQATLYGRSFGAVGTHAAVRDCTTDG